MKATTVNIMKKLLVGLSIILLIPTLAFAKNSLQDVNVNNLSGDRVLVELNLAQNTVKPRTFSTEKPARVIMDFANVRNGIAPDKSHMPMNTGIVKGVDVVEAKDRTRVVVSLNESVPYSIDTKDGKVQLKLIRSGISSDRINGNGFIGKTKNTTANGYKIDNIDFRRGDDRTGRFIVDLSVLNAAVDIKEEGKNIRVKFLGAGVDDRLARKLDVMDFGTPVKMIEIAKKGKDVEALIETNGLFENLAYQTDNRFTVEVRPLSSEEKHKRKKQEFSYVGERLSLNFQDIEVRAVLQLIADFTGLNMVASDSVQGNVTLRLQNVPWDQALDIILKTKGLDQRRVGNVILVAPTEEIATREKMELEASKQVRELAPLKSEFMQINYAKAAELSALLKAKENSLLSPRGNVSVDVRTNTLLVQDTAEKLSEIRNLINKLDIPVRQVLIEARVVVANDDFEKALGIDFGVSSRSRDKPTLGLAGSRSAASSIALGASPDSLSATDRLNVSLPSGFSDGNVSSSFGFALAELPGGTILDLELEALESEGLGTILSNPRLITSNQTTAYIESGKELPYQEASSSGATTTAFKKAVLRLEVTPHITPDGKIMLDLTVNQDAKGEAVGSNFAIDTREIHTKVLVENGDTVVLGGIYEQTKNEGFTRIPFLGKLPVVGWMFSNKLKEDKKTELMIFVTPKIIQDSFAG